MRQKIYSFSFFSIFIIFSFACFSQTTRQKILFDNDWKFFKGEVKNGEAVKYNDASWRNVSLPHDWSIEGPFSQQWASATAYLPAGIGWYRKTFTLPQSMQNQHIFKKSHYFLVYCLAIAS